MQQLVTYPARPISWIYLLETAAKLVIAANLESKQNLVTRIMSYVKQNYSF